MTTKKLNRIGSVTALVTFLIGTIILVGFYYYPDGNFEDYGLTFIQYALVANIIILIVILSIALIRKMQKPIRGVVMMLLNIPYAVFCIWFAMYLYGFYRLTVVNDLLETYYNIEVVGCDYQRIPELEPGESETLWLKIQGDCSIKMSYLDEEGLFSEYYIQDYVTKGLPQWEKRFLSGKIEINH
jgi:hypothetical protein